MEESEMSRIPALTKDRIPSPAIAPPKKERYQPKGPRMSTPMPEEAPMPISGEPAATGGGGPVFIRIDKFEESLRIFKETKDKLDEIESLLNQTKELKDKEEEELSSWEKEIQDMKSQIDRVDRDIFSKVQ